MVDVKLPVALQRVVTDSGSSNSIEATTGYLQMERKRLQLAKKDNMRQIDELQDLSFAKQ